MRYLRILFLHFEHVFEQRLRSLIWFIVTFVNPLVMILFWRGALTSNKEILPGWNISTITSYYFLVAIAGAFLISHIEEDISEYDIQKGELVRYLVKPFPYYWIKLFEEMPYRLLQGIYGIIVLVIIYFFFSKFITITNNFVSLTLAVIIAVLGFFLSNTFKEILGLLAFWIVEVWGIFDVVEVAQVVLAGFAMPVVLLPSFVKVAANLSPFAYMIYYPVIAFIGRLTNQEALNVIFIQFAWLLVLSLVYKKAWSAGIKKFTAIGQ